MSASQYVLFCFKFISVLIAFAMAGYWIHKYAKNEDNSMIEYKTFRESESIYLPAMSICFVNPFLTGIGSLGNSTNSTYEGFWKYLQGVEEFNEHYGDILYNIKIFNISHHLDKIMFYNHLKDELQNKSFETFSSLNECPFLTIENNFNGFSGGIFSKCFEIKIKNEYSNYVNHVLLSFKESFKDIVHQSQMVAIHFGYPGQLLLEFTFDHIFVATPNETFTFHLFKMDSIEIVQRRNKQSDRCLEESIDYDKLRIHQAVEKAGCKAVYHNLQDDIPICDDYQKLLSFDLENLLKGKFFPPCNEIPQVPFKLQIIQSGIANNFSSYSFGIAYPRKMKLITQQRAIDIHALIGNIGGYIGLFLGM